MKKLLTILFACIAASGFAQTYTIKQDVKTDINLRIVPNSTRSITAAQMNKILIGLWDFNVDTIWFSNDTLLYRRGGITFSKKLPATGVVSAGLTSLNSLTASDQLFAVNETGSDFTISSSGSTHNFNLPIASATHTGKLSAADWIRFDLFARNSWDTTWIYDLANSKLSIPDTIGMWQRQHNTLDTLTIEIIQDTLLHFHHLYSSGEVRDDTIPFINSSNFTTYLGAAIDTVQDTIHVVSVVINGDTVLRVHHNNANNNDTLIWHMDSVSLVHGGYLTASQYTALLAAAGGGTVMSVTGNPSGLVDNTDPANPIIQRDATKLNKADSTAGGYYPYSSNPKGYLTALYGTVTDTIVSINIDTLYIRGKLDLPLNSAQLIVGNSSNRGQARTITGDVTFSNTGVTTLATVNSTVGTFGDASHTITQTVNAKGLTTAISQQSIAIAESQVTNLVTDLAGKQATITTGDTTVVITSNGQTTVTFSSIPTDYGDYTAMVNGAGMEPTVGFTASGAVVTLLFTDAVIGDRIRIHRNK